MGLGLGLSYAGAAAPDALMQLMVQRRMDQQLALQQQEAENRRQAVDRELKMREQAAQREQEQQAQNAAIQTVKLYSMMPQADVPADAYETPPLVDTLHATGQDGVEQGAAPPVRLKPITVPGLRSLGQPDFQIRPQTQEQAQTAEQAARIREYLTTPRERGERDVVMPGTGQVLIQGQGKHSPAWQEWQDAKAAGYKGDFNQYQTDDANRKRPVNNMVVPGVDNPAKEIADAIMRGEQPPDTKGLYRYGAAVRAELAKQKYNLSHANLDWQATQRHLNTLNGPQQLRLRQAAQTAYESLDVIENLAKQWQASNYPTLNRAKLAAAKSGVMGPQAQAIATQLEAQITDVASELGNVYMGGNSPTDHALGMAAKNLSADWSLPQLQSALNLTRTNLRIRLNSIDTVNVAGVGGDNAYNPSPKEPTAAAILGNQQQPIPGIPGGVAEMRGGKWIRIK